MLSKTEIVWRHLLAEVESGRRRHRSVSGLAAELGLGTSTAHKALADPVRVGAVIVNAAGGLRVVDPFRLAVLWAGKRRLDRDIIDTWRTSQSASCVERRFGEGDAVLGGFGAVVAHRRGNTIADYDTVLVYSGTPRQLRRLVPAGWGPTRVLVAEPDFALQRYGRTTTLHQAWADLFGLADWQAARFTEAIATGWLAEAA